MKRLVFIMIPVMMLAACQPKTEKVQGLDPTDMDLTVRPGDNFYKYANGGWQAKNPLKPEYARFGSFDVLGELNQQRLNDLFQSMTTMKAKKGSVNQKISDLYKQGLDSVRLNQEGCAPIMKDLEAIYAAEDKAALVQIIASLHNCGESAFFGAGVGADLMDSDTQVLFVGQGGLGMGDRDYYTDASNAELKKGYCEMICKLFALTGNENPQAAAANALAIEDKLAEVSWTSVQNRDYTKLYNPMSTEQFAQLCPGFDVTAYFEGRGIPAQEKLIVEQPSFFEGLSAIFEQSCICQLKDYVAAQFIQGACSALSDDFYTASFDFFSRQMSGITEHKPRWKRAMSVPNGILGEAVGKMYVEKYFPASSKKKALELVENLRTSLGQHIDALDWMSDSTKAYAREKLAAFTVKIGYPDKWKDYSTLDVNPELSYYENLRAASIWYIKDNLDDLGKPTDRSEWGMTPQTVNAYYNPTTNEICFPAAILQPPFFNADADDAVNYGAIGVVIGHEMTHGFDDQGRLFDKDGNMNSWWADEDDARFREKTAILEKQYSAIEILPGLMANGTLSLGENIADHGGLSVAYTALRNSIGNNEPALIDGLSADQRFFLGYARVWADNITDEEKARRTKLDVHSLGVNRVNAALRNFQEFFDAFGIAEGDPMWLPESERVHIW